jgi:hypothetical protein
MWQQVARSLLMMAHQQQQKQQTLTVARVDQVVEGIGVCGHREFIIGDLRVLEALHGHSAEVASQRAVFRQDRALPGHKAVYEPCHGV